MEKRLTGLGNGAVDVAANEVRFALGAGPELIPCVAKAGVLDQIIAALAHMSGQLRAHRSAQKTGVQAAAAERIAEAYVRLERLHDEVVVQFVTDKGAPYTFVLPRRSAADIADRLKTESERDVPQGRA